MDEIAQTSPETTINPETAAQTAVTGTVEKEPPRPSRFQLKQQNEAIIARLMKTRLFPSKHALIQAALLALFQELRQKMAPPTSEPKTALAFKETDPNAVPEIPSTLQNQ